MVPMIFQQYYLSCLSHASYLIGDEASGRAVVVDPQRDVDEYVALAEAHKLRIERVIETHFHADFLSGHLELAARTGAAICYGEPATADFPIETLRDGQRLDLGDVTLEIRATPGHTPESISVVVYEHAGDSVPHSVLTGDTLFIGDVGRPDLLSSEGVTSEQLARVLFRSLREKLLSLPDETRVYPAHGAGSSCGKSLSTETVSTIGEQRRLNYALQPMTEDEFVGIVTEGQPASPPYFGFSARRNRQVRALLDEHEPPEPFTYEQLRELSRYGAVILDTRDPAAFAAGHLRSSINVGLGGRYAEFAGDVLSPDQTIVLVCDEGHEVEAKVRLARIGFDRVVGYLDEPTRVFLEHPEDVRQASRLTAADLDAHMRDDPEIALVDVRNPGEVALGKIDSATHIPLARLVERMGEIDPAGPVVVYCAGGYRSSIAASVLRANGLEDVSDLLGGYEAWRAGGLGNQRE